MHFKTKIILLLLSSISLLSFGYTANEIWATQSTSSFSNCSVKYLYLNQDNNQNNLPDYQFVPKANYIYNINSTQSYDLIQLMLDSNIQYYMSTGNMVYTQDSGGNIWVIDDMTFGLQSWVFPYKTAIRAVSAYKYINIEVPSLTWLQNPIVALKYNYILKKAIWYNWTTASSYRYRWVPSLGYFGEGLEKTYITNNTRRSWSSTFQHSSCTNYNVQWCGDGKTTTQTWYTQNWSFHPVSSRVSTWFTAEVCDWVTETGAVCVNGTAGCCNTTCSGFGNANERCGDEILQPAGTFYNGDQNNMSFEECDDGDEDGDTDWMTNGDDPNFHFCSSICLPTFTEAFVEVFIN